MATPYSARAIVLRSRALGEKDRVLTLFSAEHGRFSAVAKGARNPKGKQAAASQPFVLARFLVAPGRSLNIATQSQIEDAHIHIAGDLTRTAWACYVCELCDSLPEAHPDAELFETLEKTLDALNDTANDGAGQETAGLWFQARLLHILGYAPTIGHCVVSGEKIVVDPADTEAPLEFSPALGGTLCSREAGRDAGRMTVAVSALRALHRLGSAAAPPRRGLGLSAPAQWDLREALRRQIGTHLDAKLKSQKFLDEILTSQ